MGAHPLSSYGGGFGDEVLDAPGGSEKVALIWGWKLFVLESASGAIDISATQGGDRVAE